MDKIKMGRARGLRVLAAVAAAALLGACGNGGGGAPGGAPQAAGPAAVEVLVVQPRPLAITQELPGRIAAARVAEVRARVAGIVLKRHFQEGADIQAGQLLFSIDPAPYRAALARAEGELAKADAAVGDAQAVVKRYTPLAKVEAVSQQDLDTAQTALKSAQAARTSALADVQTAQLNLGYTRVTAPIAGRIGRAAVTEGALVGQGEATALATIQQLHPIYADFTQPVADVVRAREAQAAGKPQATPLVLSVEGARQTREGRLVFADVTVDRSSGQISLRGEFPNQDALLLPGMYVRVRSPQATDPAAVLVPQRAVKRDTEGRAQVMVLGADGKVQARPVQAGTMVGADWHILSGLAAGDKVIVGGPAVHAGDQAAEAAPPAPAAQAPAPASNKAVL